MDFLSSITPNYGVNGDIITITGTEDFETGVIIYFGAVSIPAISFVGHTLTCYVPLLLPGIVNVSTSQTGGTIQFTYSSPPPPCSCNLSSCS